MFEALSFINGETWITREENKAQSDFTEENEQGMELNISHNKPKILSWMIF